MAYFKEVLVKNEENRGKKSVKTACAASENELNSPEHKAEELSLPHLSAYLYLERLVEHLTIFYQHIMLRSVDYDELRETEVLT
jgi:hypothetical protein